MPVSVVIYNYLNIESLQLFSPVYLDLQKSATRCSPKTVTFLLPSNSRMKLTFLLSNSNSNARPREWNSSTMFLENVPSTKLLFHQCQSGKFVKIAPWRPFQSNDRAIQFTLIIRNWSRGKRCYGRTGQPAILARPLLLGIWLHVEYAIAEEEA